jgi:hypothetical protein
VEQDEQDQHQRRQDMDRNDHSSHFGTSLIA